ncbi:unnamed protein product, partial [Ilex paraguariensis]
VLPSWTQKPDSRIMLEWLICFSMLISPETSPSIIFMAASSPLKEPRYTDPFILLASAKNPVAPCKSSNLYTVSDSIAFRTPSDETVHDLLSGWAVNSARSLVGL